MQKKITTFLTFNDQAEEAVNFYTSIFENSKILSTNRYGEAGPGEKGSFMSATFELAGQEFIALNGGQSFTFAQGISLFVDCEGQEEVERTLGEALRRGREGTMRLAHRSIWGVVANHSSCPGRDVERPGS